LDVLSIFPLRTSDPSRYYIEAVSAGAEEYYLRRGEMPGRWLGRCAETLGLSGAVDADDLRTLLAGRRPDGSNLRESWVLRPGYDATFSAPKSVSVLWAVGDRTEQQAVIAAHDAAVDGAIDYLERHACRVRRGGLSPPGGPGTASRLGHRQRHNRPAPPRPRMREGVAGQAHDRGGR